ncbi:MAG: hypothetical protein ACRC41_01125 [Sarcina sp.]
MFLRTLFMYAKENFEKINKKKDRKSHKLFNEKEFMASVEKTNNNIENLRKTIRSKEL